MVAGNRGRNLLTSTGKRTRSKKVASSITKLFPNSTVPSVLSLFCLHPDREFYQREVVERTGSTALQVQRALARIEQAGLLRKVRRGNRVYYSAEQMHPAFEDLKNALIKTTGLADLLREALSTVRSRVELAFLFGSIAAGTERAASDIDLMVVGDAGSREIISALGPVAARVGREFNPVVFRTAEFQTRMKQRDHFLTTVLRSPKIWLVGRDDDIAEVD